jgi:hypothetical protein
MALFALVRREVRIRISSVKSSSSPHQACNLPLEHVRISQLLVFGVQIQRNHNQLNPNKTMRVSKGVKVLLFGMTVLLGFSASAPKALAQG